MMLKDIYGLINGIVLISVPEDSKISYANYGLPEPPKEILEREIKDISPFYNRSGLYKYGVIVHIKEKNNE